MNKNFLIPIVGIIVLIIFYSSSVSAQLLLNEISATNYSGIQNSTGEYDDWIELHNNSASSLNIGGYGLSDDSTKRYLFTFPSYTLNAGAKVLVFANGKTNNVIVNHWEMAVDAHTSWRYIKGIASIDTNWRNLSFNQSVWSSGNGGIGFADGDDGTTISVGVSVMMRKEFTIPDTSLISKAILMMDYDDGFVAYLNGVEIVRANLGSPSVRPLWNDVASSSHEALDYQGLPIDSFYLSPKSFKSLLRPGTNVLAVETHNSTPTGNDLSSIPYLFFGMTNSSTTFSVAPSWFHSPAQDYFSANFKLARSGEKLWVTSPGGTTVDSKAYPPMQSDNSIGRKPDGASSWCFISTPTPNASNNGSTCYTGYANDPIFSKQGGYYSGTQTLTLTNTTPGGSIRYTTNGNVPTSTSTLYTGPLSISSPKAIRAKVFASGYLPSNTVTNTFFINATSHLPTFAITTDSSNLWDWNTGIYVMGPNASQTSPYHGANFWMDWEKPASIEYFDRNKNLVVRFNGDIKIYGNYTRANPKKSFEIKLHDHYGMGSFNYPIIPDKPYVTDIDNIVLRNGGTGQSKVNFRDAFMERMLKTTYSGYLATDPATLFLNGEYWGTYHINENHDHHWMRDNFGLNEDEIDHIKERGSGMEIQRGSDASFWTLYNYATTQSPTSTTYYNQIDAQLDLKNYTDYFAAETFYNNGDWMGDWTNNIQLWRPNKAGGKWKYLVYDLDFGLGFSGAVTDNRLQIARNPASFCYSSEMFDAILNNPTYKKYFINRYADLMNTIWLPANANSIMHSYKDTMAFDETADKARWGGTVSQWNTYINDMMTFESGRLSISKNQIKSMFSLQSIVTLTLNVSPANAGRIEISTITPTPYPWSGDYFNGNPVTITAIPNPGYSFDHWHSTIAMTTNNPNQSVTYNFTGNDQITAYFTGSSAPVKLCVSELNYNSNSAYDAGDWIELHNYASTSLNLSGWWISDGNDIHKFKLPTGTVIPANGYLVLSEDSVKFKSQFPTVNNVLGNLGFNFSNGGDQVRIFDYNNSLFLSFYYQDLVPWPLSPDGDGYTLELTNNLANPNNASSWFAGCMGGSPGRAYTGILLSPVSISGSTNFCSGQSATLSASTAQGYTYQWKKNSINIPGAIDSSLVVTQSGSYSVYITSQGCGSETTPTVVSVVTQLPAPQATSAIRCGSGALTLHASSNDTIFWYDANTNGNLLGFGDSLITPTLNSSTTYYARAGGACQSVSTPVNATVLTQTAAPVTALNVSRCGPGPITLTASDTAQIRWYNQSSSGALLQTGSSFTTNTLFNDTIYYVEAGTTCPSGRVEIFITVTTAPSVNVHDTSRCGNGTMVLTGISPSPVTWYNDLYSGSPVGVGGLWTTPFLAVTDTFYAETVDLGCASVRQPVIAIVNNIPTSPVVTDTTICSSASINLNAIATEQVRWYTASSGGTLLYTGSSFTTPTINTTTVYYVENGNICLSNRVPLTVYLNGPPAPPASANVIHCGPGNVTLIAASPELITWFDAPSAGNLLAVTDIFITPFISTTTTYYAEAGTVCKSQSRTAVQAIINNSLPSPSASNVSNCGAGSMTLTASSPDTVYWYSAPSGGTPLSTSHSYTTPVISNTTTYYVEARNNCTSTRVPVLAQILSIPSAPSATSNSKCGPGSLLLTATGAGQLYWYTAATGGTLLDSGATYNTPVLNSSTTYYVETRNGTCKSIRSAAVATINSIPAPPTTSNVSVCSSGTATLTANSPEQIYWYSVSSGGSPLSTGSSYTTGVVSSTTTYYVEAGNTCRSPRIPVVVTVNSSPNSPVLTSGSRCGPGTVTLSGSSSGQINWYTVSSGGSPVGTGSTYTTTSISATTTYYAETGSSGCTSARVAVAAVINSIPAAPTASGNSLCGAGSIVLNATGTGQIYWYTAATGGTLLDSGATYNTPVLNSSSTYYVETRNGICKSTRSAAAAIINSIPAAPTTSNVSICSPGTATLTASSPEQIFWYSVSSGGTPLSTGSSYTTGIISSTTTYYVEAGNICRSTRIPVVVTIGSNPNPPVVTSGSHCGPGTVTLSGSSSGQITWYTVSSGGSPVGTGLTFTTPSISATTTYYAETGISGCTSARVAVVAVINNIPAAPTASGNSLCGPGSLVLSATGSGQLYWYTAAAGGTLLDSGATFHTPNLNSSSTYYVETRNGTCKSTRSASVATIIPLPAPPTTSNVSICSAGTATLTANSPEQIYWYSVSSGGTPLSTGSSYTTGIVSSTTTYYVEAGNICRSTRIPVVVTIGSNPNPPVLTSGSHCGPGTVTLSGSSSGQINWYTVSSGGSPVGTGLTFTTPSISATTTYYAETGISGCTSARISVVAVINNIPAAPTASGNSLCGAGSVTLTASSPETIYWYSAPSGGTLLGTGSTYTTASISSTTTYYVEAGNNCRSVRIPVQAIITTPPNPPTLKDTSICGSSSVVLHAVSSTQVNWYDVPSGGTSLFTGLNFTTPILNATTIYYAEAGIGCNSIRVPVTVSINNNIAPPATADITRCGAGAVTLNASAPQQIYWYDSMTGGNQVGIGTAFTTPLLSVTTTYFVATASGNCSSARIPVQAIIGGTQVTNLVEGAICGSGIVVLSAICSQPVDSIVWYDQPGGNVIGVGQYYISPMLTSTTTYYVVASSACTGLPMPITAFVFPNLSYNMAGGDTLYLQSGTSSTLDAGTGYTSYNWSTNESSQSIIVSTGGWYSVTVTDANGCSGTDSSFVDVFTGIGSIEGKNKLEVYPNPTHDHLTISIPQSTSKEFTLKILSVDGKIQMQEVIKNSFTKMQSKVISLDELAAGVYVLELIGNEYIATVKVVLQ